MASIFKVIPTVDQLNKLSQHTMVGHLGIEFLRCTEDSIVARMPVDERTHQPMGLLHGGASVALAETLGSVCGSCCVESGKQTVVGLEINANHIKSARSGWVTGISKPIHVGKRTQVWEIRISNDKEELVCISRITLAVIDL